MAEETGRIKAGRFASFLEAKEPTKKYIRIGRDLEEFTHDHNRTETIFENIFNEISVTVSGTQRQTAVAPYYCYQGEPLFEWLWNCIQENRQLTDLETKYCEVELWHDTAIAREQTVTVSTTLHGVSAEAGLRIEFNLIFKGDVVEGTWTPGVSVDGQQTGTFTPRP